MLKKLSYTYSTKDRNLLMSHLKDKGRKLPKNLAVEKVTTKEIALAAKRLGYKAEIEGSFKYPKTWWDNPGRVVIDTKGKKKSKILLEVAREIRKIRGKG